MSDELPPVVVGLDLSITATGEPSWANVECDGDECAAIAWEA